MQIYEIITLVDITRSNASRSETDPILKGQQANFNTLLQSIGMRSNVEWKIDPKAKDEHLPIEGRGKIKHWTWQFECERNDVFNDGKDPVGLLLNDLNGVPIIELLTERYDLTPPAFITKGEKPNTWVKLIA
jgi:hypothetical protein